LRPSNNFQDVIDCLDWCKSKNHCPTFGSLGTAAGIGLSAYAGGKLPPKILGILLAIPGAYNAGSEIGCALGCAMADLYNDATSSEVYPQEGY
jgi:hypothetical protein